MNIEETSLSQQQQKNKGRLTAFFQNWSNKIIIYENNSCLKFCTKIIFFYGVCWCKSSHHPHHSLPSRNHCFMIVRSIKNNFFVLIMYSLISICIFSNTLKIYILRLKNNNILIDIDVFIVDIDSNLKKMIVFIVIFEILFIGVIRLRGLIKKKRGK